MATPTILVVDDSRAILATMKEALSSAGYDVLTADDGDRAIALIMSRKPDLIVSDIQMPNLDGFFLCQLLKARPETRNIPFMFLTALDGVPKRLQGLEMGDVERVFGILGDGARDDVGAFANHAPVAAVKQHRAMVPARLGEKSVDVGPALQLHGRATARRSRRAGPS